MTPANRKAAPRASAFPEARAPEKAVGATRRLRAALSLAAVQSLIAGAARLSLPQNPTADRFALRALGACIDATEALDGLWLHPQGALRPALVRAAAALSEVDQAARQAHGALAQADDFDECVEAIHAATLLELARSRLSTIRRALDREGTPPIGNGRHQ